MMVKSYREKPREVEAIRFANTAERLMTVSEWLELEVGVAEQDGEIHLIIGDNEIDHPIEEGDFLVKYSEDVLAVLSEEAFYQSYDRVFRI